MQILAGDVLELTRLLSPAVLVCVALLGMGLWLFGARTHRFWLALLLTLGAGVMGLSIARDNDVQPLVAGLLMALSAGVLCLALARVSLFIVGGLSALFVARMALPGTNELVTFLAGGLVGVLFYQVWLVSLSSFAGTVLMAYGGVSLYDRFARFNSVTWADQNTPIVNWAIIGTTCLGILLQFLLERRRAKSKVAKEEKRKKDEKPAPPLPAPPPPPPPPVPWWKVPLFNRKSA